MQRSETCDRTEKNYLYDTYGRWMRYPSSVRSFSVDMLFLSNLNEFAEEIQ